VGQLDILEQVIIERRVGELENWLRDIVSRSLDGDIIVLLEVDTGLLLGWVICNTEKLTLETRVGWTWNMLPITPLSITRATSRCVWRTTTGSRVAIRILVEGRSDAIPSSASWRAVAARLEIGSVGISPAVGSRSTAEMKVSISRGRRVESEEMLGRLTR
jgi:hypothetical protein